MDRDITKLFKSAPIEQKFNKINNKFRMVGGSDCGYTYTPANGPCLGPHPANIVTPSCSTATAPVSGDISSSAGLYMTQSGGGSKSNLKFSLNKIIK